MKLLLALVSFIFLIQQVTFAGGEEWELVVEQPLEVRLVRLFRRLNERRQLVAKSGNSNSRLKLVESPSSEENVAQGRYAKHWKKHWKNTKEQTLREKL